jgi:hypothetical protein
MAYRKIDVNGKTYEYTIGRTHLKVKGMGAVLKEQVGHIVDEKTVIVTPKHVSDFIQAK